MNKTVQSERKDRTIAMSESKMEYVNLGKSGLKVGMMGKMRPRELSLRDARSGIQDHPRLYAVWFWTIVDDPRS